MKKLLFIFAGILILTSCSAPKLYQQGIKKINKAIAKDPSIKLPSDTIVTTVTKTKIDTVDNEIIKTIVNTVTVKVDTCEFDTEGLKTTRQLRFERRMLNDSLDHAKNMFRLSNKRFADSLRYERALNKELTKRLKDSNTKEEKVSKYENKCSWFKRTLGNLWWLFILLGAILGYYLSNKIKLPFFKK